jgi:hypothetical protein
VKTALAFCVDSEHLFTYIDKVCARPLFLPFCEIDPVWTGPYPAQERSKLTRWEAMFCA